jgi:hypothetical protein
MTIVDKTVLVTGASRGIGRATKALSGGPHRRWTQRCKNPSPAGIPRTPRRPARPPICCSFDNQGSQST